MKKFNLSISFLIGLLCLATTAFSQNQKQKLETEKQIEDRVQNIMKGYDNLSVVFATVEYGKTSRALPATPFVIKDTELDSDFEAKVSAIRIVVYSKLTPMPSTVRGLISDAVAEFKITPTITFKGLPNSYGDNLKEPEQNANVPRAEAPQVNVNLDELTAVLTEHKQQLQYIYIGVGSIAVVLFIVTFFNVFSNGRSRKIIEQGLSRISSSVQESANNQPVIDMPKAEQARSLQQALPPGSSDSFKNFEIKSLVAMLTDCYWGQYDTFAAYIWKRIPVVKRTEVLSNCSFLEEYVHFLSGMDEQNLGYEQEPYYLNPLDLHHVDNDALTELVRKNPGLIAKIPNMRVDSLNLDVKERIRFLSQQGSFEDFDMPNFSGSKQSELRILKKHRKFSINSVEEEIEILAIEDLDPFVCRDIPTLGFLARAEDEKIREVLDQFSAQELAQAWVGPEDVLAKLKSCIPEKKMKLVEAYLERINPSRQSRPFQVLNFRANNICFPEKRHDSEQEAA